MNKKILTAALFVLLLFSSSAKAESKKDFVQQVYGSVVLLYGQTESGGMQMRCTATAYRIVEKDKVKKTRFISAAHCVSGDSDEEQAQGKYFISLDSEGQKTFIPAALVRAGDKKKGDDFSIFEVEGDKFPIVPVGDSKALKVGDEVVDVSAPLGLGKIYFQGYVGNVHLDRPPLGAGEVQWTNVMIVEIGGGPGSSGSAVVSVEQKAIVAFVVGSFNGGNLGMIAVPAEKFKAFEAAVDAGTYKKTPKSMSLESFLGVMFRGMRVHP